MVLVYYAAMSDSRIVQVLVLVALAVLSRSTTTIPTPLWPAAPGAIIARSPWWTASIPFRPTSLTYSGDTVWVCGADEMIAKSDDGGRSWQVKHQNVDGELLLSIVFGSRVDGFASGSHGAFLRTTDGGETWTSSSLGTSTINAIAFADDRNGMLQTGSIVEMTDDSGVHWSPVTGFQTDSSKRDYLEVMSFARLDANRAAIALHQEQGESYFFVTQDAGKTWKIFHIDNTFADTLFSRNSEYWAFGSEYLERQKSGGYSAPVVLHSSNGISWSHGARSPHEFNSCTPQGCILYDGAITNLYGEKPTFLAVPADGTLQPSWAVAKGNICVAGIKLKCAPVETKDTPPPRPILNRPISIALNESRLFDDCIQCSSGTFAVPNTFRFSGFLDVSFDVAKDGTAGQVKVEKAPTVQIENEIQNIVGAWLFVPPRENGVPVVRNRRCSFKLDCFAFRGNDEGTCGMVLRSNH